MMRKIYRIVAVIALLAVAGCASSGPAVRNIPKQTVVSEKARIVIEREEGGMYSHMAARVKMNGVKILDMSPGDVNYWDTTPGVYKITTDSYTERGVSIIVVEAKPGQVYRFMVSPLYDNIGVKMLFGFMAPNVAPAGQDGTFKIVAVK